MKEPSSASFLMKMIVDRAESLFVQNGGKMPVTAAQCRVLMYLEKMKGQAVSQRELERYLGVSHTTVKGLLQRLEEKGLVRTAFDDSSDARVKHAYLTDTYEARHVAARDTILRLEETVLSPLDESERRELKTLLSRVLDNMLTK
ncbi:MAG: MarR family transcriptional regulator [Akkermansia sp.]|nr:MarR family transcriptional regulator [Akkermansia sp.]